MDFLIPTSKFPSPLTNPETHFGSGIKLDWIYPLFAGLILLLNSYFIISDKPVFIDALIICFKPLAVRCAPLFICSTIC